MSERDRDSIDNETKNFTKQCVQDIDNLKTILGANESKKFYNSHSLAHLHNVITLLYFRLQQVTEFFTEQRAIRLKQSQTQDRIMSKPIRNVNMPVEERTSTEEDLQLDERERKLLEEENLVLQNRLETTVDKARQIERKVAEISELQHIFATKVAEQGEMVDVAYVLATESRAHVDKGVQELHKAARRGVDFRIFVLLFLIVASVALLFLHWITP